MPHATLGQLPVFLSQRQRNAPGPDGPLVIVGVSADGTHFVDQFGQPRLFVGEDCWQILPNGGIGGGSYQAEFDTYFSQRAAQGFTAVEVTWAQAPGGQPFTDGRDWDGTWPFASTMDPTTTPNPTFWAKRDYLLTSAAAHGITVVMNITTASIGDPADAQASWTDTQWQTHGTFLGNRYKNQPNLLWIFGDDYFGTAESGFNACLTALRAAGDNHPCSIQNYQETHSRQDIYTMTKDPNGFDVHAQYSWGYSYNPSYDVIEKTQLYVPTPEDDVQGPIPPLWADGFYLESGVGAGQTDVRLERQNIWWALSSGAAGFSTGDNEIYPWYSTSAALVTGKSIYTVTVPAAASAFRNLTGWHQLAPDTSSVLVTGGRGTHVTPIVSGGPGTGYVDNTDDYVTASRTPDTGSGSSLAVIYCGLAMDITIDQSKMKSGYTATWVDPVNGATYAGTTGSTYNSTTARGNNSAGDPDWVLVLRG